MGDSTGPMRRKILEAVQNMDWNAIDLLHCGSANFNDRRAVSRKYRDVLQEHGTNGVEVEIKESRITQCCSSDQDQTESEPSAAKFGTHISTFEEDHYKRECVQVSKCVGTEIASSRHPTREDTKGLYPRIQNTETVVALTCRHAVFGLEEENIDFRHDTYPRKGDPTPQPLRSNKIKNESNLQQLEPFEYMESRSIGYVLFSPYLGLSSSSPARFRDWALIELDQKKHQTLVKDFGSTVPETLSPVFKEPQYMLWEDFNPERMRAICVVPGAHIYTQTGVMPEAEMRCPDFDFAVPGKTVVDEDFMRGDSGDSVMGDDGRAVAILTSGAQGGNRGIHHISYATPIEWLLEDIRGHGYDVEWMGKEIPLDYLHNHL
ncbi:hypothetical protein FCOIX_7038 [Fusarium coicis]|nr:hypothetical protein FCOIX_7038 [Fusarium coicis]